MAERWIVVHNWPAHQHYTDRDPIWIKDYVNQLNHDEWRRLSFRLRGILESVRLAYASSNGRLTTDTRSLTRQLGERVMTRDLETLNDAGFIDFSASRPLALTRSREKRREEKKDVASAKRQKATAEPWNGDTDVSRLGVCPECGIGGGLHVPDCSYLVPT